MTQLLGVDVVDCQGCGVIQERQLFIKYDIANHVTIAMRRNSAAVESCPSSTTP